MRLRKLTACLFLGAMLSPFFPSALAGKQESSAKLSARSAADFKALMQRTLEAWDTLNPDNAAPFYAKDRGNVFYDAAPLKYTGWAAYSEGAKKVIASFASLKFTLADDVQVHTHGTLAWATATFHADFVTKGGVKQPLDGRWTVVWEKRGKDWLIVHEHVSAPLPPLPSE
jgi:ketosteroid isomerase-like protein